MKIIMTLLCTTVLFCSCKNVTGTDNVALPNSTEAVNDKNVHEATVANNPTKTKSTIQPVLEREEKTAELSTEKIETETTAASPGKVVGKQILEKADEIIREKSTEASVVTATVPEKKEPVNISKVKPTVVKEVETPPLNKNDSGNKTSKTDHQEPAKTAPPKAHAAFDALLKKYVTATGKVNYKGLKADVDLLNAYLAELSSTDISALNKKAKLAFYINAYNAFTIKKIVDNYPVKSITDLDGGKPWDVQWISLNNQEVSLNNIENDIIRPTFNEPRIHFAVNCAAKSCPPLLNKAWTAENLETNFEKQAKAFINNPSYNQLDNTAPQLSKIFEWYAVDFGDLIAFINKYAANKISSGATLGYKEYDWSLNE